MQQPNKHLIRRYDEPTQAHRVSLAHVIIVIIIIVVVVAVAVSGSRCTRARIDLQIQNKYYVSTSSSHHKSSTQKLNWLLTIVERRNA